MAVRADIMEISRVLGEASRSRDLSRFEPPSPLGREAQIYGALMKVLPRHRDVPASLTEAAFRPLFLVNGLIVAASLRRPARAVLLESLAAGLLEFADYFEFLATRFDEDHPPLPADQTRREMQARYFAYCAAQLVECGVPVSGVLATMKGDALDEETTAEVRGWIEHGPSAMLSSSLLSSRERELWRDVFEKGRTAWPPLRSHLIEAYHLPFRALPER